MRILLGFLIVFVVGCHPAAHMPEPSISYGDNVPLSRQLIVQTEGKLIPKLEKDYARIELRYIKTLSKSSGIYLFHVNPVNMSIDALIRMLRRDVRITQVQTNKEVTPR